MMAAFVYPVTADTTCSTSGAYALHAPSSTNITWVELPPDVPQRFEPAALRRGTRTPKRTFVPLEPWVHARAEAVAAGLNSPSPREHARGRRHPRQNIGIRNFRRAA